MREDEEDGGVVSRDENRPDKKYRKYSMIISLADFADLRASS